MENRRWRPRLRREVSRAGHDSISTTLGYVKMAEDLSGSIGEPFASLPRALRGARREARTEQPTDPPGTARNAPFVQPAFGPSPKKCQQIAIEWSGRRDLNPRRRAPKARALPDCATPRGDPRTSSIEGRTRLSLRLGHSAQRLVRVAERRGAVANMRGLLRIARDHHRETGGDEPRQRTDLAETCIDEAQMCSDVTHR